MEKREKYHYFIRIVSKRLKSTLIDSTKFLQSVKTQKESHIDPDFKKSKSGGLSLQHKFVAHSYHCKIVLPTYNKERERLIQFVLYVYQN